MKKTKVYLLLSLCLLGLVGCTQMENDILGFGGGTGGDFELEIEYVSNRIALSEYQLLYEDEIDRITSNTYANLSFQDCNFMPVEGAEAVGIYQTGTAGMSADESIGIVENWLVDIGCENVDLTVELRDASGQYARNENIEYPYDYPAVYDYYPDFDSGRGFFINTNACYIQMGEDGIYSMSDGSITEFLGSDGTSASDALGTHATNVVAQGYVAEMGDESWELVDGEMSVSDAAMLVKEYFEAGTPRQNMEGVTVDVPEVAVFELGNKYGYDFQIRRVYNGVPFVYGTTGSRTYYSSQYWIIEDIKHAYLINHDTVSAFTGYSEAMLLYDLIEEQTDIMSLEDAVLLLEEYFATEVMLKVDRVELAYCTYEDEEGNEIVYPCWWFEGVNETNDKLMRVYVNVLNGDIYYYAYRE